MSTFKAAPSKGKVAFVITVEMLMVITFGITLNVVSPMITSINAQTGWSLGQIGQFNSIVFFLMGAGAFIGSPLMDRFGSRITAIIALALATAGHLISFVAGDVYIIHWIGRFLYGCGWGIFFLVPGSVITFWLPPESRATIQGLRCTCDFGAGGIAYYVVMPIFNSLNENWQASIGIFGIALAIILVAYIFGVPINDVERKEIEAKKEAKARAVAEGKKVQSSGIVRAAKSKQVWIICLSLIGAQWIFNSFTTYLPAFFEVERGFTAEEASRIAGMTSFFGIVSGLLGGALSSAIGRRKVLTWPSLGIMILGTFSCLFVKGMFMSCLCSGLIGFGFTAFMTGYTTIPGELPGADNDFYAGAVAIIYGIAFMITYIIPYPYDAMLSSGMSMQTILAIYGIPGIVSLIASAFIMETGPKGKYMQSLRK